MPLPENGEGTASNNDATLQKLFVTAPQIFGVIYPMSKTG